MCVSCGCGVPDAAHGDDRHITLDDLEAAAKAVGLSVEEVVRNIVESIATTSKAPSDPTTKR
jgi:hypothetical protein